MEFSLRFYIRRAVFRMLSVIDEKVILIVDSVTSKITSTCFIPSDFSSRDILEVEEIEKKRVKRSDVPSIYFLSPQKKSIELLVGDFEKTSQYKSVHLYLTSLIEPSLNRMVLESRLSQNNHLLCMDVIHLNFETIEECVFLSRLETDFNMFCGQNQKNVPESSSFETISSSIYSLMMLMKENPIIRYDQSSPQCTSLAKNLNSLIHSDPQLSNLQKESILVICDRRMDFAAPLLHEFTYQGIIEDLFHEEERENIDKWFDERDKLWVRNRHDHLSSVPGIVAQISRDWVGKQKGKESYQVMSNFKISGIENYSLEDIIVFMDYFPDYSHESKCFSRHIELLKKVKLEIRTKKLLEVAEIEQNICLGVDGNGENFTVEKMKKSLEELFEDESVTDECKLRLLILFLIFHHEHAGNLQEKLVVDDEDNIKDLIIQNLNNIFKNDEVYRKILKTPYYEGNTPIQDDDDDEEEVIVVSRYRTKMSKLINLILGNKLSENFYPLASTKSSEHDNISFQKTSTLKSNIKEEDEEEEDGEENNKLSHEEIKEIKENNDDDDDEVNDKFLKYFLETNQKIEKNQWKKFKDRVIAPCGERRKKLFVFCIGGICYSEIRDFYKIMKIWESDVIGVIGSTSILTPRKFLMKIGEVEVKKQK